MSEDLHYTLSEPLEFSNLETGSPDKTFEVTFRAPTYREIEQATAIEQLIYGAFVKAQRERGEATAEEAKEAQEGSIEEMTGAQVMVLLSMYADQMAVIRAFEKIAIMTGSINDETRLVEKHIRSLSISEIKRMCGAYIAFFIMPSVLSEMERAFSDG